MQPERKRNSGGLPGLAREMYRGRAFVHWTMTIAGRATGWLDEMHHARVRELLCHALGRTELMCPAYCLMPDHGHFVWVGCADESDHKRGAMLFREAWNALLARESCELQKQAFDHVLRDKERERGAFSAAAHYALTNPVRRGLVSDWKVYPFSGALVPGYPDLDPRTDAYWERFWRIYAKASGVQTENLTVSATLPNRAPPPV